jgi:hypothetical protein
MRFTCASGPWRSVELRQLAGRLMADPVAVSHDPPVAERLRYDHLLLTSLSRPRDVAELCLAFEVHRRLM